MLPTTLRISMAVIAAIALALAGSAHAQDMPPEGDQPGAEPAPEAPPEQPPPQQQIPGLEQPHPLVTLHAINQIQSQLGLMGLNEAANEEVRDFAGDLAESYSRFDRRMLETANDLEIDVAGSGQVRMAMEERLQNLDPQLHMLMEAPPQMFDTAFIDLVVRSQQDAIEAVQQLQGQAQEDEVQSLLEDAVEGYQSHLERAQELQAELGEEEPQEQEQGAPEIP